MAVDASWRRGWKLGMSVETADIRVAVAETGEGIAGDAGGEATLVVIRGIVDDVAAVVEAGVTAEADVIGRTRALDRDPGAVAIESERAGRVKVGVEAAREVVVLSASLLMMRKVSRMKRIKNRRRTRSHQRWPTILRSKTNSSCRRRLQGTRMIL